MALNEHPLKTILRRLTEIEKNKVEMQTISNENGTAIKFSDGTLICYGRFLIEENTQHKTISFPEKYIDTNYTVTFTNTYTNSVNIVYTVAMKTTIGIDVYPRNPSDNSVPTLSTRADFFAIGKWK